MKKLICAVIVLCSILISSNIESSYIDKTYYAEYPCTIMESPSAFFIMTEPGIIIAEYK